MRKLFYLICCFTVAVLSSCSETLDTGLPDRIVFYKDGGVQKFVGHNLAQYEFSLYDNDNPVQYEKNDQNVICISSNWVNLSINQDTLTVQVKDMEGVTDRRTSTIHIHDYISSSDCDISIRQYGK